jgi:hypothetical protein
MDKTEELIRKTEGLLRQFESLQAAVTQLQEELRAHSKELGEQLGRLCRKSAAPQIRPVTTQERRANPRRKGNPVSVFISNGSAPSEPMQGWVLDRSTGGIRLLVDDPIEAGTVLNIRPVKVHAAFPWVQVKVKNCYPERKSWCIGCQFIRKLSWEDMQHFG